MSPMAYAKSTDSATSYVTAMEAEVARALAAVAGANGSPSEILKALAGYAESSDAALGALSNEERNNISRITDGALARFFAWNRSAFGAKWSYSEETLAQFGTTGVCTDSETRLIAIFFTDKSLRYSRFMLERKPDIRRE
jgi:hypothetical protein